MNNNKIFYGAGRYAESNLDRWISEGNVPLCFADANSDKHYTSIKSPKGKQVSIFPLHKAIQMYPDADYMIAVSPALYIEVFDYLVANGIAPTHVYSQWNINSNENSNVPAHCNYLGRYLMRTEQWQKR